MSATATLNPLAAAAAAFANGDASGEKPVPRKITAPVALTGLASALKSAGEGAYDFVRFILKMIAALFQRIAALLGVKMKMSDPGQEGQAPADSVGFSSEDPAKVSEAATRAGEAVNTASAVIEDLMRQGPDREQLQGEGAHAYAVLALGQLGQQLRATENQVQNAATEFEAHLAGIGRALGVSDASVRAMIETAHGRGPSYLAGQVPPASEEMKKAVAAYENLEQARKASQRVSSSYADHAAAILAASNGEGPIAESVRANLKEFASEALRTQILSTFNSSPMQESDQVLHKFGSSGVDSAKNIVAQFAAGAEDQGGVDENRSDASKVVQIRKASPVSRVARFAGAPEDEDHGPKPGGPSQRDGG